MPNMNRIFELLLEQGEDVRVEKKKSPLDTLNATLESFRSQQDLRTLQRFSEEREAERHRLYSLFRTPGKNLEGKLAANRAGALKEDKIDVEAAVDFYTKRWEQDFARKQQGQAPMGAGVRRARGSGQELDFTRRKSLGFELGPGATERDLKALNQRKLQQMESADSWRRMIYKEQIESVREDQREKNRWDRKLLDVMLAEPKRKLDLESKRIKANLDLQKFKEGELPIAETRDFKKLQLIELFKNSLDLQKLEVKANQKIKEKIFDTQLNIIESDINRKANFEAALKKQQHPLKKLIQLRQEAFTVGDMVNGLMTGPNKVGREKAHQIVIDFLRQHPTQGVTTHVLEKKDGKLVPTSKVLAPPIKVDGEWEGDEEALDLFNRQILPAPLYETAELRQIYGRFSSYDAWHSEFQKMLNASRTPRDAPYVLETINNAKTYFGGGVLPSSWQTIIDPELSNNPLLDLESLFEE